MPHPSRSKLYKLVLCLGLVEERKGGDWGPAGLASGEGLCSLLIHVVLAEFSCCSLRILFKVMLWTELMQEMNSVCCSDFLSFSRIDPIGDGIHQAANSTCWGLDVPIRLEQNWGMKGQSMFYRHVHREWIPWASDRWSIFEKPRKKGWL